MNPNPVVIQTLADEFNHLNQWFGAGKYRLANRSISYGPNGRVYDVLTIATPKQMYRVLFDATRIRPPAPAGAAQSVVASDSSLSPVLFWTAVLGAGALLFYCATKDAWLEI